MSFKKIATGIAVSCLLFNLSAGVLAAVPQSLSLETSIPYTNEEGSGGEEVTPPDTSTDPEPEPDPNPPSVVPDPEPAPEPEPQPPAATPDSSTQDSSGDYDDYYYDDSYGDDGSGSDDYTDEYDYNASTDAISEDSQTTEEKVQEVQQVTGDTPMTITSKETTVDVTLEKNAYTTATTAKVTTLDFSKDTLAAAITAGKGKLDEKRQGGDTKLERVRIFVPKLEAKDLSDTSVSLRVLGETLNALSAGKAAIVIPVNDIAYTLSPGLLSTEALKNLGNDGRLMVDLKAEDAAKGSSYKISESQLTPQLSPVSIEASTVKATGAMTSLDKFESPMTLYVSLPEDIAAKLTEDGAFTGVAYDAAQDTLSAKPTSYRTDSKTVIFSVDQPGSYTVALRTPTQGINPVLIAAPICLVCALGVILFILHLRKKSRGSFGSY